MTRIEKVIKEIAKEIVIYSCPDEYFDDGVRLDKETEMLDEHGNRIGCHGITCEQCWNEEVKE